MRIAETWLVTFHQGLPLFRREMLVQSVRIRTYVIRSAFAVVLFLVALCYAAAVTGTPIIGAAVRLPGQGHVILDALVWMLFALIYVFAPATASGVITLERERQTLVLLYLTKLTAWHVILEKFLSRLLPLLIMLLLAMPLLVLAYTFGGVSPAMLGTSMWFLLITAVQVTAVAVLCSTLCQRTTQAFIVTYGVLLLLYLGPLFVDISLFGGNYYDYLLSGRVRTSQNLSLAANTLSSLIAPPPAIPSEYALFACFPPTLYLVHYEPAILGTRFAWSAMLTAGAPTLLSAAVCLLLAPLLVFYRAFDEQRFNAFQRTKRLAERFGLGRRTQALPNERLPHTLTVLPGNDPIAWRESTKGSRNWVIFLLLLEIPALVLAVWFARTSTANENLISAEIFGLWAVSALLICVHTASLFTRERSQQTFDLLLTTPLTSAEIVQQKFNGIRNLMITCAIPLISCMLFEAWWRTALAWPLAPEEYLVQGEFIWWEYLITSIACIVIYFQIIGWIALWAGMRNKSPTRATLQALGGLLAFCCVPQFLLLLPLLILLPVQMLTGVKFAEMIWLQITPVVMIMATEFTNLSPLCDVPLAPAIVNVTFYGALLIWFRGYVLQRADVLLGRTVHY
ncbi:MAG: gliding motility-associated transporter permease protein [Planctomycetaceae bacterium]|nr:gliding motility-associated transporter permease protein [Planctomycetaceae bacterium]